MKERYLIIAVLCMLYVLGYGQELQRNAKGGIGKELTDSEIYQRIRRVGYERRLKIDSAKAMILVRADENEQKRIHEVLEDGGMTVNGKAVAIKNAKDEKQQVYRRLLTAEQLAKVYGTGKRKPNPQLLENLNKSNVRSPLNTTTANTEELERIHLEEIRVLQEKQNKFFESRSARERPVPLTTTQDQRK